MDRGAEHVLETYSVDILAVELSDELLEALLISLDANGAEDVLDISSRRGGVATNLEEEVCSQVTHLTEAENLFSVRCFESVQVARDILWCYLKVENRGKPQITVTKIAQNKSSTARATMYLHLILKGRPVDSIRRR
jgi:hypothetical protein